MKRYLAILAVPVLAIAALGAIAFASQAMAGVFGPLIGWPVTTGFILLAAVTAAAFAAEAIHRLILFIEESAPQSNRKASRS